MATKPSKKKAAPKKAAKKADKKTTKPISLHPLINKGVLSTAKKNFAGGTLTCHCATDPVSIHIKGQTAHNHACGCSKCWKPEGAVFSIVAVTGKDNVSVTANGHKLKVVDDTALIRRHACTGCGVHLYGRVENTKHGFYGLDFVHTELSKEKGWSPPTFAAFVSSIIGQGFDPGKIKDVRARLKKVGLPPHDCLSEGLMDYLATHDAKQAGVLKA